MSSDPADTNLGNKPNKTVKTIDKRIKYSKFVDLIFGIFCTGMIAYYLLFIQKIEVPIWDGAIYLINAHEWLNNISLSQSYIPPLFSWIIDAIWIINGEDWMAIKYVQMAFTIAGVILLYIVLRKRKSALFALGVSVLTLTNAQLFFYTSQILTEGISLFFLILTLYFFEGTKKVHWILSGISIALTFAARYPILLQSIVIFLVESIIKRDPKSTLKGIMVISVVIVVVIGVVYLKTGTFQMRDEKGSSFGNSLSSFYIVNAIPIWGYAILLVPVAFLFKSTFKDKFNYIFMTWFIISLLSWSSNASNYQYRFMIQFMPAVYFLVMVAVENLFNFKKDNLIFVKSKSP
jgi:4-amino-4-deoxy-L-arabinose transferase-like glycosyltransferase